MTYLNKTFQTTFTNFLKAKVKPVYKMRLACLLISILSNTPYKIDEPEKIHHFLLH